MLLDRVFQPFLEKRPICVMAQAVLSRILDPNRLDDLFHRTAKRQYEHQLLFSSVIGLMADVVLQVQPSVHAAYQSGNYDIQGSLNALYKKIDHLEPDLAAALVRDSAEQTGSLVDELDAQLDPWLPGYRCRVLDGNHLSATEHRLEPLRTTWTAPLPGKVLVILDPQRMVAEDVVLIEDGHAQERSALDQISPKARPKDLWIADRNFGTIGFMADLDRRQAKFLFRQHGTITGTLLGKRRPIGRTDTGMVYEQKIKLEQASTGDQWVWRRVTVVLDQPTRDGDREIHLLTNLPKKIDARQLANLYRNRWTIETVFGEITATLACEINTLCYPKAALLVFCLALLAYNAVSVLKAALRSVHGERKMAEDISNYYLSLELQQTYDGMMVCIPLEHWSVFRDVSEATLAEWLTEVAGTINLSRYQKHRRGPKKKPPEKDQYKHGGHVSTARLLEAAAEP